MEYNKRGVFIKSKQQAIGYWRICLFVRPFPPTNQQPEVRRHYNDDDDIYSKLEVAVA